MKIILLFLISFTAYAQHTTNDFNLIYNKAIKALETYDAEDVLLVLDIDNTLLKMNQQLGSDQWFNWQYDNCLKGTPQYFCVGKTMSELLDVQEKLFALSKMEASQEDFPKLISDLQSKGFKIIALTSRGPEYRNSTERELNRNGYNFIKSSIGQGHAGLYQPYLIAHFKNFGLNKYDLRVAKLKSDARKVSYMNGIMMTSGLNKGIMLKTLLHKTNSKPKLVLFVDDHSKHTIRMQRILSPMRNTQLMTFRYSRIDPMVERFNSGSKKQVIKNYNLLSKTLLKVFK